LSPYEETAPEKVQGGKTLGTVKKEIQGAILGSFGPKVGHAIERYKGGP